MKQLLDRIEGTTGLSRREFLLVGGAVVTTFYPSRAGASGPKETPEERKKISEIMERYGSELGRARYVDWE